MKPRTPRRKFTKEFKDEAVKLVLEAEMRVAEVAEMFDIHRNQLDLWVRKYRERHESVDKNDESDLSKDEIIKRLEREKAEAQMERDILKKALAIFSKDPK